MFRVPYRWLPRTFWANIASCWGDITNGVRNVLRWTPVIWYDADFDWAYLSVILEKKLRWMANDTRGWHVMGADKDRKHMLICAEILKRLHEDDYFDNAKRFYGDTKYAAEHAQLHHRNDLKYFGLIMGKYLNHWWD